MVDIKKVDAALRRAAHCAVHGSREERSGRFLHLLPLRFREMGEEVYVDADEVAKAKEGNGAL